MSDNNNHNVLYFKGNTMDELHNSMDEWQKENEKRFLSMTVQKDRGSFCCITLTNPSEVYIVDGSGHGNRAQVSGGKLKTC